MSLLCANLETEGLADVEWRGCRPCWRPMPGTCGTAPPSGPGRHCGSSIPGYQRCSGARTGRSTSAGRHAAWTASPVSRRSIGTCCATWRRLPGLLPVWAFSRVLRSAAPGCRASIGTASTRVAPRLLCVHSRVSRVVGRGLHVPSRPTGADRGAAPTRAGAAAPSACRVASSSPSNPVRLAPLVLVMGHNQRC